MSTKAFLYGELKFNTTYLLIPLAASDEADVWVLFHRSVPLAQGIISIV